MNEDAIYAEHITDIRQASIFTLLSLCAKGVISETEDTSERDTFWKIATGALIVLGVTQAEIEQAATTGMLISEAHRNDNPTEAA